MAGLLSAIGGTLAGLGQGMAQQAEEDGKAKREARLAELQHGYRMDENRAQNDFTAGQNDLTRQFQSGENKLNRENTLENTRLQGVNQLANTAAQGANTIANTKLTQEYQTKREDTKFGQDKELENLRSGNRIKEGKAKAESSAAGKDDGDLTPADQRELNLARQSNINPITKQVDWLAAYRQLKGNGRDDLAQRLVAGEGGAVTDAIRKEAQKRAEAEADGRAGWFSTDSSDFKDDGGDRSAFIKRRTSELVQQEMGGGTERAGGARPTPSAASASSSSATAPAAQGEASSAAKPPAGKGTQAEPFTASSQADIEWFKTSAPKGAVIIVNGKPFTK